VVSTFAFALLLLQQPAPDSRVQRGIEVLPDTVTVGDHFRVVVRIRAPRGALIEFPQTPDSGGAVDAVDPVQVAVGSDTGATDQTAVYRLAAWDVGRLEITFPDVIVRLGRSTQRVRLAGAGVFVASVLPADSALRVPKPVRDVITFGLPWWIWALLAVAIAVVALLLWWLWRRRRRKPAGAIDPYLVAERSFARVEALGLVAAGERAHHVALMVEVLRDYLDAAIADAPASLTTQELLAVLRGSRSVPVSRLSALLGDADLVKFARRPVTTDRATDMGREARLIAGAVHAVLTRREERAA
jgi:hypothetical protein